MEADNQKDNHSDEDIPSDFFDDFNKDDFIKGLSVIDSWDDDDPSARKNQVSARAGTNTEGIDDVKDLRELIDADKIQSQSKNEELPPQPSHSPHWVLNDHKRSRSASRLDAYIQPGSRRDPTKTSEAIRKDKEVKVKEFLAKHLESSDELRPPGTELDDFFESNKKTEPKTKTIMEVPVEKEKTFQKGSREWERHGSPRRSPRRKQLYDIRSARRSPRRSPIRRSPQRRSPYRRSPHRRSPYRRSPQRRFSPRRNNSWRFSPSRKFHKFNRFSPTRHDRDRHYTSRRSRSRSIERARDDFLYPKDLNKPRYGPSSVSERYSGLSSQAQYMLGTDDYPITSTDYLYAQGQMYPGYSYDYTAQPALSNMVPVPQPVPAPNLVPSNFTATPAMVPPPLQMNTQVIQPPTSTLQVAVPTPAAIDPLAQLVAEGKLSHEDYLKLAPNKGSGNPGESHGKAAVLKRCSEAISELDKLALPTRLLINNSVLGADQSRLAPKFCSPLKRQVTVEFHFTKASVTATTQQNKQIIDNIIAAVGLEKIIDRTKKKSQKNTKDAAVQTTTPFCDICEIRSSAKYNVCSTSTEPEYFTSSVHTQVVEQDLINSKSVFNPTGSAANNPTMSIAHLTPAQLVSQLAARAKTLKHSPDQQQQFGRHNSPGYDPRNQQGRHYYENNYRYQ